MSRAPCALCGRRPAHHQHHLVHRPHLRERGASLSDPRNLIWLCGDCHMNGHWSAFRRLPISVVTEAGWEFAREVLKDYAEGYMRRYYDA